METVLIQLSFFRHCQAIEAARAEGDQEETCSVFRELPVGVSVLINEVQVRGFYRHRTYG